MSPEGITAKTVPSSSSDLYSLMDVMASTTAMSNAKAQLSASPNGIITLSPNFSGNSIATLYLARMFPSKYE